jgi:hypothetical protein
LGNDAELESKLQLAVTLMQNTGQSLNSSLTAIALFNGTFAAYFPAPESDYAECFHQDVRLPDE